jgi:hypothetical protein
VFRRSGPSGATSSASAAWIRSCDDRLEFGRRTPENTSLGTGHGTAHLVFNRREADHGRAGRRAVQRAQRGDRRTEELRRGRFAPFPMCG